MFEIFNKTNNATLRRMADAMQEFMIENLDRVDDRYVKRVLFCATQMSVAAFSKDDSRVKGSFIMIQLFAEDLNTSTEEFMNDCIKIAEKGNELGEILEKARNAK